MTEPRLDFLCVGPQRTASSWLHKHLVAHPRLAFPLHVKETMFFDERYDKGLAWYWDHFGEVGDNALRGEIAPTYFDSEVALERLRPYQGLKVIVLVRDPVERTYSLFRHHRSKGRVPDDYMAAAEQMPRIESSGHYAKWCGMWESAFGEANVLYLVQDEIQTDPQAVFDRLCGFLGVEQIALSEEATQRFGQATQARWPFVTKVCAGLSTRLRSMGVHRPIEFAKRLGLRSLLIGKSMGEEPMPDAVRERLNALYAQDIAWLEDRLGRSIRK
ncbi:MAG: sulfotransferase family protein [Phycisphaeraceae bacterium]